jgi:hypothetical protein
VLWLFWFLGGLVVGGLVGVFACRRVVAGVRGECVERVWEARRGALGLAAARLRVLAGFLRERGCFDVVPRVEVEAEALERGGVDPGEVAYYRCLIGCLGRGCRVGDCLVELGFGPGGYDGEV